MLIYFGSSQSDLGRVGSSEMVRTVCGLVDLPSEDAFPFLRSSYVQLSSRKSDACGMLLEIASEITYKS